MTCDLCGTPGHMKRACPRLNDDPATPKKQGQKQQSKSLTSDSRSTKDSSRTTAQRAAGDLAADAQTVVAAQAALDAQANANAAYGPPAPVHPIFNAPLNPRTTRSHTGTSLLDSTIAMPVVKPCKQCFRTTHKQRNSHDWLRNPKGPLFVSNESCGATDSIKMDTEVDDDDDMEHDDSVSMQY
ncbi:hypothetical protein MBANPS3_012151 [Mucor bainieri]